MIANVPFIVFLQVNVLYREPNRTGSAGVSPAGFSGDAKRLRFLVAASIIEKSCGRDARAPSEKLCGIRRDAAAPSESVAAL
jgi:hypothetical protein